LIKAGLIVEEVETMGIKKKEDVKFNIDLNVQLATTDPNPQIARQ
jgi:hypothetical protein